MMTKDQKWTFWMWYKLSSRCLMLPPHRGPTLSDTISWATQIYVPSLELSTNLREVKCLKDHNWWQLYPSHKKYSCTQYFNLSALKPGIKVNETINCDSQQSTFNFQVLRSGVRRVDGCYELWPECWEMCKVSSDCHTPEARPRPRL